jgi:hypothetical protein
MKTSIKFLPVVVLAAVLSIAATDESCDQSETSRVDQQQRDQQAKLLAEGSAQTGMPAIRNFRERKLLKDILELRDQDGLVTYTYTFAEMSGQYRFFCDSVGYGIPYATQYTNPERPGYYGNGGAYTVPQADPNGLFSPSSAEGTWVMCKDPGGKDVRPVYVEPRVIVSAFKLP